MRPKYLVYIYFKYDYELVENILKNKMIFNLKLTFFGTQILPLTYTASELEQLHKSIKWIRGCTVTRSKGYLLSAVKYF